MRLDGIKYMFKYVCRDRGRVAIQIQNKPARQNENENFVEGRYVSASEAEGRTLRFGHVDRHPLVVRLDVYLQGYHTSYNQEVNE